MGVGVRADANQEDTDVRVSALEPVAPGRIEAID